MPVKINDHVYYRTAEVYRMVGISKNTLFRWLRNGILDECELRDRRGWRLFTENEIERLKTEADRVVNTKSER